MNDLDNFIDLLKANAQIAMMSAQLTEVMFSASNALEEEKKKNDRLINVLSLIQINRDLNDIRNIVQEAIENNKS